MAEKLTPEELLEVQKQLDLESSTTQTVKTVPYDVFKEKNDARKVALERAETAERELAEIKDAQKEAEEKRLKEKGEFQELYTGEKEITENLNAELKQYEADDKARWESIAGTIPEDKQKFFPKGESKEQIRANLTKYQEWTEAGVFKGSTIPSTNTSPPTQSHIVTGKIGPDSQGRYFDTEADFLKTSSDDYGKWLTSKQNLNDVPIGVFKAKGQEYTV